MALHTSTALLTHTYTEGVEYQTGVERIKERVGSLPNAHDLYNRALEEFENPKYSYPKCLALGEISPGSILMSAPSPRGSLSAIIVDWKFVKLNGRGVNADIAGFLASIPSRCFWTRSAVILKNKRRFQLHSCVLCCISRHGRLG